MCATPCSSPSCHYRLLWRAAGATAGTSTLRGTTMPAGSPPTPLWPSSRASTTTVIASCLFWTPSLWPDFSRKHWLLTATLFPGSASQLFCSSRRRPSLLPARFHLRAGSSQKSMRLFSSVAVHRCGSAVARSAAGHTTCTKCTPEAGILRCC